MPLSIIATEEERYFKVFFEYVRRLVNIPESDRELCRAHFKTVFVPKNTILERAGQIHGYHNFIVSGYMRNYYVDADDKEVVTDINDGPRFFTSYHHFMNRTPSNENLHCITDCELLRISRDDVDRGALLSQTQVEYTMLIIDHHLERTKQRNIDLRTLTADERYVKLLNTQPNILRNVPLKYLASYLGINPGSLSRIRQGRARNISSHM